MYLRIDLANISQTYSHIPVYPFCRCLAFRLFKWLWESKLPYMVKLILQISDEADQIWQFYSQIWNPTVSIYIFSVKRPWESKLPHMVKFILQISHEADQIWQLYCLIWNPTVSIYIFGSKRPWESELPYMVKCILQISHEADQIWQFYCLIWNPTVHGYNFTVMWLWEQISIYGDMSQKCYMYVTKVLQSMSHNVTSMYK